MISESKSVHFDMEDIKEPRDLGRYMWVGVIGLFAILGVLLYFFSEETPEQSVVRVRHILIKCDDSNPSERAQALARIREIRQRVLNGEDFGKLAEQYSNDPATASKGGDLGYVRKGDLVDPINKYVWTAPIGQLSEVIKTQFGFHIVVVDDRKLSKVDALEEKEHHSGKNAPASETSKPASPAKP